MKARPFIVHKEASGRKLSEIDIQKGPFDEAWLQELLRQQPEILPVAEIEPVFYPLVPIGREVPTESGGAIDNLFISHRGYLVLVETKLWRNPEAKRLVVAQAIDYGSSLSKWKYDRLNDLVRAYTKKYEKAEMDLVDWVEKWCKEPVEGGAQFFEETVTKNLRLGRFLTLIVGDKIRTSLIEMLNHANTYPHLATDIAMVELQGYLLSDKDNAWPLLIVPNVVARTEIIERSVVQITIDKQGDYQLEVKQEKSKEGERKRVTLTEEAFWELLKKQSPINYEMVRQLISYYSKVDGLNFNTTESSIVARLDIQDSGYQASAFYVTQTGYLGVWPMTIDRQLAKAQLDSGLAKEYGREMRNILKMPEKRVEFSRPIHEVDLEKFKSIVNDFIEKVRSARPNES